jgi:hypothetical protein
MIIVLNPEVAKRLDYEQNWADLVTYESYLSIIAQKESYANNASGYERVGGVQ